MADEKRVIVVGGGLAGLAASVRIAEAGVPVDLFSMVPVKRSHSVCAQGGINACNEVARQQGYSEYQHFDETLIGGDFLNDQHPVLEMANWAPKIIDLLDRMGVPFNRTHEGFRDLRLFGGSLFKRTHFSGATTGQQLLYALDEQTRRYAHEGKVNKMEFWEFLWPITEGEGEDRRCVGIVAQDMRTMQIRSVPRRRRGHGDGRVRAGVRQVHQLHHLHGRGGVPLLSGGARGTATPEMIQVHPTAIPGARQVPSHVRVRARRRRSRLGPREEGRHPTDRTTSPKANAGTSSRNATRSTETSCPATSRRVRSSMSASTRAWVSTATNQVYLDLTHRDPEYLTRKLGGIMDIYEKFVGDDPRYTPMRIFPAVHYSMGGLWTTYTPGPITSPATPGGEHKPGNPIPVDAQPGHGPHDRGAQQHDDQHQRAVRLR